MAATTSTCAAAGAERLVRASAARSGVAAQSSGAAAPRMSAAPRQPRCDSGGRLRWGRSAAAGRAGVARAAAASGTASCPRTPKLWISGDQNAKCDAIKKLRLITAIKTPYLENGRIDLFAYDRLVERQIAAGVEGLIVGGTTGEGQLMSWDEHIMLIAHTAHRFGSQIAVIGNTGSNATREAVHATCQGFAVGMDAALHINPYYGKTSRDGLMHHFGAVLDYGPTIVYNVPGRTGQDIAPDVVHELAAHPNFAGMKECCGNERIRGYTERGIVCWSGNDDEAHDARWGAGAVGVISVTSNVAPELMRRLMFDGPDAGLNGALQPLMRWLFVQPNPIGVNTALAMLGCCRPVFRLPYTPYGRELREEGARLMAALPGGRAALPGDRLDVLEAADFTLLDRY